MANIIIKGKTKYGKTRAEQEANLRKDGFIGMENENFDKVKWLERKCSIKCGFIRQTELGGK